MLKDRFFIIFSLLSLCLYFFIGQSSRNDFLELMLLYSGLFALYFGIFFRILKSADAINWKHLILLAVLFRMPFFLYNPQLSDDFYRFLWDGYLTSIGENPFLNTPQEWLLLNTSNVHLDFLFDHMNSQQYYTVYPPLHQLVFFVGSYIGGGNVAISVDVIRSILLLFEIISMVLLPQLLRLLGLNKALASLYIFNPLLIVEVIGNLHFEGMSIALLALTLYVVLQRKYALSGLFMALAAAVKLLPLMLIPLISNFIDWKRSLSFLLFTALTTLLLYSSYFSLNMIYNMGQSLDLYFQKFEFNASLYYIFRWIGMEVKGYNLIQWMGPLLMLMVGIGILFISFRKNLVDKPKDLFQWMFFAFVLYYLLATTVHPWYIINILFFGLLSRFYCTSMIWSWMAFLSYHAYGEVGVAENGLILIMEYSLVFAVLIWELRIIKFSNQYEDALEYLQSRFPMLKK